MNDLYQQILDIIRGTWRFRWLALAVAWASCVAGWVLVGMRQDVYEAQAHVYIDTSSDLRQLLSDQIVDSDVTDQLRFVREALLGSARLERVAVEAGLAESVSSEAEMQRLVEFLSRNIRIMSSTDAPDWDRSRTDQSYLIYYQDSNRGRAIAVVQKVLDIFVEDTLGGRRSSSAEAEDFLVKQIRKYEERLARAEEQLANFNRQNFDRLPSMQGGYFQRLQNEIEERNDARQELRLALSRLDRIEQQLSGAVPQVGSDGEVSPNSLEGRLAENQGRLDDLRLRYTENHPDVVAAREIVEQLRRQQEERQRMAAEGGSAAANATNPVFQALQISRNEIEAEIATLRADVADRESRVDELRGLIDEMPAVEAELARLNRDYNVVHAHYQSLLDSYERKRLSQQVLESEQVDFRIIDPPAADPNPIAPNRAVMMAAVLMGSLGFGGGLAYTRNHLNPVVESPKALELIAPDYPLLGSVSTFSQAANLSGRRRSHVLFTAGVLGMALSYVAMLAVELGAGGLRNLI